MFYTGKIDVLFAGFDAGYYGLPDRLVQARAAVDRLNGFLPPEPQHPLTARQLHVEELAEAAAAGRDLPPLDNYTAAVRAHEQWTSTRELLTEALALAEQRLVPQDDVVPHLADAMQALTGDLVRLAAVIPEGADDRLMAQPGITDRARKAWRDLDRVHSRYVSIRAAQSLCAPRADETDEGEFASVDNLTDLWPSWSNRKTMTGNITPPWPEEGRARLLWMVRNGARFVVLMTGEREARWQDKYGAIVEARRRRHVQAQSFGGLVA